MTYKIMAVMACLSFQTMALEQISDDELNGYTGQNGIYLSGDISLNEVGGPLASTDTYTNKDPDGAGPMTAVWGTCAEKEAGTVSRCGARLSVNTNSTNGYFVLDEMRGKMSFEGLTIKAREITSADDANFGGDVADYLGGESGKTVLEIGLPNEVRFENLSYTIANSSTARPTDDGFQQQNIFGVELNGSIEMKGNLLVFPVGTP
jgi:hypothetical protein